MNMQYDCGVTASNACFPLFPATTNCLDFLLFVGPERAVPNHTYLRRELIVSSLCSCIDTEAYCSVFQTIIHARADFHAGDQIPQRFPCSFRLFVNAFIINWRPALAYGVDHYLEYLVVNTSFICNYVRIKCNRDIR